MRMKYRIKAFVNTQFMPWTCMNWAWTEHEITMIVAIKSMKYGPKFPNFLGVARENLLCFEHEHGHVHAQEPWTIFAWEGFKEIT